MTTRTSSPILHIEDQLIGHTADRERIFASVRIDRVGGSEHETVNHETISEYLRFSFTWAAVEPLRKVENAHIAGCGTEWSVDAVVMPAQGFTIEQIRELGEIAKEWHTNDLNAGCAHQTVVWENGRHGRQPSLTLTHPCEISGYKYGRAWLVRVAPDDLVQRIAALFGREVVLND